MASQSDTTPIVVIVGQTASGKTALALELARLYNGEIIAADSRTIYRTMDIGTAKPTRAERQEIPHHIIDVVTPDQQFSAAAFVAHANRAISDIAARGRLPIIVGGTGLYIDALLYAYSFRPVPSPSFRSELEKMSVQQLQSIILQRNLPLPNNDKNPRHLIRTIETDGHIPQRNALRTHTLLLGLAADTDSIKNRIRKRVDAMVDDGLIAEIRAVVERYGWDAPALQAPGYRAFKSYLTADVSLEAAKAAFVRNDTQLAKRQRTWFRRNKDIIWINKTEEAVDLVTTFLNN